MDLASVNSLEWVDLNVEIWSTNQHQRLRLLEEVSGVVKSSQVCIIIGPSGAGKTTLLNVLAGRDKLREGRISGEIKVNGLPRVSKEWKKCAGYVEQFDLLHNFLTPREIFYYSAKLKCIEGEGMIEERIETMLLQLGLTSIQSRRISCGISGGEKKRISIGVELIGDPFFLFLDEPTSGLDAFNAFLLLKMLQILAKERNKCILMTLHQPRCEILELADNLMILTAGKVVYFGAQQECQRHFERLGFMLPERMNPADFFLDLVTKDVRPTELGEESVQRIKSLQTAWKTQQSTLISNSLQDATPIAPVKRLNGWQAFLVLLTRESKDMFRNGQFQCARIIQSIFFFILLGLAFLQMGHSQRDLQNRLGVLFFICINVVFSTLSPYLHIFADDRKRIIKERASDCYRGYVAYLAKIFSDWPALLIVNLTYHTALYWTIGLQTGSGNYFFFILVILVLVVFAQVFSLTTSAAFQNAHLANVAGPTFLIIFVIFGGNFLNPSTLPGYLIWLYWISPFQYAYKAIAQNEFTNLSFTCSPTIKSVICFENGKDVLTFYYLYNPTKWTCLLVLVGITLVLLVSGMIILEVKTAIRIAI